MGRKGETAGEQPESPRAASIRRLTGEIDHIKREIERSEDMRNRSRILYEFERPSPFRYVGAKYVFCPERRVRKEIEAAKRIEMSMDYIIEARTLSLIDVLRQSKKLVFSKDWAIGYEERRLVSVFDRVDRERKKNRLVREVEKGFDKLEVQRVRDRKMKVEMEKIKKLEGIKEELMKEVRKRIVYNCNGEIGEVDNRGDMIPRVGRDDTPCIFAHKELKGEETGLKTGVLEAFKKRIEAFSKCNSMQSSRSNFQMSFPTSGIHPSNQHIFKKISGEQLRCRSIKELVGYKYRAVDVEKDTQEVMGNSRRRSLGILDESLGEAYSSKDEDELEFSFSFDSSRAEDVPVKANLETSFDKFLGERPRRDGMASVSSRLMDFMKGSQDRGYPRSVGDLHRFPGDSKTGSEDGDWKNTDGARGEKEGR